MGRYITVEFSVSLFLFLLLAAQCGNAIPVPLEDVDDWDYEELLNFGDITTFRNILGKRGYQCTDCETKEDFAKRVIEIQKKPKRTVRFKARSKRPKPEKTFKIKQINPTDMDEPLYDGFYSGQDTFDKYFGDEKDDRHSD